MNPPLRFDAQCSPAQRAEERLRATSIACDALMRTLGMDEVEATRIAVQIVAALTAESPPGHK